MNSAGKIKKLEESLNANNKQLHFVTLKNICLEMMAEKLKPIGVEYVEVASGERVLPGMQE